ncbi:MAG TPA: hypothetical protein VJM15_04185 [Sphingomicrobium sp.]|nr:hypothetical protein [Sphingomicrobium sp.]
MVRVVFAILAATAMLAACRQTPQRNDAARVERESAPAAATEAPAPPATGTDPRTPLPEPGDPIDPKSVEAAGQVVQHYGALIEQGRWKEGWALWGSADAARRFERNFRDWADVHLTIGNPGDGEGAAGSVYVAIPSIFYGNRKGGDPARLEADVILRRVNDVPGSTETQRRWHIERIEASG